MRAVPADLASELLARPVTAPPIAASGRRLAGDQRVRALPLEPLPLVYSPPTIGSIRP